MADPNTRQGKRTPVTLKIKFKSETLEQFIERYAVDVSQGGIFIRTKEPLAVGTQMRFEFQLRDASPLIAGEGTVVWTRENDPSRPAIAPGMGVRFDRLAEGSQTVLERILAEKAKQAPQRSGNESTKPPMFTDTPTRVAPATVQDALLGDKRADASFNEQGTPLPKPMPFHSDADDFDEQAFEEATKVRALDELIAQTAGDEAPTGTATAVKPADELSARRATAGRADSTLAEPPAPAAVAPSVDDIAERESAPGLPSPPEAGAAKPQPRLLDTTPSPRTTEPPPLGAPADARAPRTSEPPPARSSQRIPTPLPMPVIDAKGRSSAIHKSVAAEPSTSTKMPVAPGKKSSSAPLVILLLLVVAAGAAGVWFFYLRPKAQEQAAQDATPGSGSAIATGSGDSAGSAAAGSDTAGSAAVGSGDTGSAAVAPAAPVVETAITASVDNATVEVVDTDQKGIAPFTAKLEQDRAYKVRIGAPGFATTELDVKGGDPAVNAKLVPKPRVIQVTSEPAGALILVNGAATKKTTPAEIELTKDQAAKKSVKITLRKGGFRAVDKMIATDAFTEGDAKLEATVSAQLSPMPVVNRPPPNRGSATPPDAGNGESEGSGSATPTTPPAGSGSAAPTTPPATTPPATTPPAPATTTPPTTAPTPSSATKPAEPEPDFVK